MSTLLLVFLLPSPPFTFDVLPPPALCDPLSSLRRQYAIIVKPVEHGSRQKLDDMRHKSPSSPKPSAQLPAKQLTSPLLPLFPPPSAPCPASTTSSAERAADGCPSPISYWDQPDRTDWDFDNTIYCDSTGCSYDAKKNPRVAKYAVTVAEFDNCSYEEYNDTVFLCGQCNMKCLRKVNGSKIKSKMPIERFLAQRDSDNNADSFAVDALDLPLPPPSAADFPELPRAAPTPRMTKAEKAMANKINTLLLSDAKGKNPNPGPTSDKLITTAVNATLPVKPTPAKATATALPATLLPPKSHDKKMPLVRWTKVRTFFFFFFFN